MLGSAAVADPLHHLHPLVPVVRSAPAAAAAAAPAAAAAAPVAGGAAAARHLPRTIVFLVVVTVLFVVADFWCWCCWYCWCCRCWCGSGGWSRGRGRGRTVAGLLFLWVGGVDKLSAPMQAKKREGKRRWGWCAYSGEGSPWRRRCFFRINKLFSIYLLVRSCECTDRHSRPPQPPTAAASRFFHPPSTAKPRPGQPCHAKFQESSWSFPAWLSKTPPSLNKPAADCSLNLESASSR